MSRYLTPSKIAVLALVHLYCDSVVPSAAVVPFLSFILSTLGGSPREDPAGNRLEEVNPSPASAAGFEHDAVTQASSIPGRTIFDLFIKKLWEIDSLDALHTFIQESGSLFSGSLEQVEREDGSTIPRSSRQISLSRNSPLGIFVRRVRLEFTRLQFSDALKLWLAFTAFKEPTLVAWERQNRTLASHSFDRVLQELDLEPNNGLLEIAYENSKSVDSMEGMISASDIERILEFQVDRLQRMWFLNAGPPF